MSGNKPIEALPGTFSKALPLTDKIKFVLSLLKKAGTDEIAMEIVELQGIASEQGVADITVEVAEELQRLVKDGVVSLITEPGERLLYNMNAKTK